MPLFIWLIRLRPSHPTAVSIATGIANATPSFMAMCREIVVSIERPSRGDKGEKRSSPCRARDPEDRAEGYSRATATSRRSEESNPETKLRSISARLIASLAGTCRRPPGVPCSFRLPLVPIR